MKPNFFPVCLRTMKSVLLFAFALTTTACFEGKIITRKIGSGDKRDGVVYALPRTVVRVDVPIDREDARPGRFAAFTPCFFPGEKFIMVKSTGFSVNQEKVRFDDSLFIPDTSEIYLIKTTGGKFETKSLDLELTQSGVFVKATAENTNETIDVVTGLVASGVSLAGKAILPIPLDVIPKTEAEKERERRIAQECYSLSRAAWDEAIAAAPSPEVATRLRHTAPSQREIEDNYEKAKEIAEKIGVLIARRVDILNTETSATVNGDTLKLLLEQLDSSIKTLKTTAFLGVTDKITWNASFRLNPRLPNSATADPGKLNIDLLTLSNAHGVCSVDVNQGVQLDPRFQVRKECPIDNPHCRASQLVEVRTCSGKKIRLKLEPGEDGEGGPTGRTLAQKVMGVSMTEEGERGFYYRVPGRAIAYLYQGEESAKGEEPKDELGRAPVSIAQFGPIVSLPSSAGGRRTKYTLALYEASGGLKNFVMGSSALIEKSNVEDLTGAASTALDTRAERKKAKQPKDELEQLERQRKILEEKKKIRDLENQLNQPVPPDQNP